MIYNLMHYLSHKILGDKIKFICNLLETIRNGSLVNEYLLFFFRPYGKKICMKYYELNNRFYSPIHHTQEWMKCRRFLRNLNLISEAKISHYMYIFLLFYRLWSHILIVDVRALLRVRS
jgi:hypothetical protein